MMKELTFPRITADHIMVEKEPTKKYIDKGVLYRYAYGCISVEPAMTYKIDQVLEG